MKTMKYGEEIEELIYLNSGFESTVMMDLEIENAIQIEKLKEERLKLKMTQEAANGGTAPASDELQMIMDAKRALMDTLQMLWDTLKESIHDIAVVVCDTLRSIASMVLDGILKVLHDNDISENILKPLFDVWVEDIKVRF